MFINLLDACIETLTALRDSEEHSVADLEEARRVAYMLEAALSEEIAKTSPVEEPAF